MIASGIWVWAPRGISALDHAIRRVLAFTLVIGLLAFYVFEGGWAWLAITAALCWQGFFEFVFPLIVHRKVVGYENKLKAQMEIERNAQQHLLVGRARRAFGDSAVRLAGISLLIIYLAYFVGIRAAKNQEEFFVLTDRPGAIVAAIDDNVVILANYDQTALSLTGSYQVERLSESRAWKLQRRRIGKLTGPKSNKTSVTQSGP